MGCIAGCNTSTPPAGKPAVAITAAGFQESAASSGIDFTMHFLPSEQGEHFKINLYDHGCGVAVGDYDGDGYEDIYFLNQLGRNALYRNKGDGTFVDVTDQAGVALGDRVCGSAVFADYDNDGHQDLFVTSTRGGNVLFHNDGNGKFTNVTAKAGLTHVGHSQAALFFDYNRDGLLDLFITNTASWTTEEYNSEGKYYTGLSGLTALAKSPIEYNILYRNNGDGTFTDVTKRAGLKGLGWSNDATAFDYDEDGWIDLFVTNMFGRSQLYRNNHDGTFEDVTLKTLGKTSWGGMGAKAFDFNNDGKLDLYTVDMHSDMWMGLDYPAAAVEEQKKYLTKEGKMEGLTASSDSPFNPDVIYGNTLFRNDGHGKYTEVSDAAGVETWWPWGIAAGDFNNDGYVDVFVPSGMGYPLFYWRNYLLMNNGNGTFTDRSRTEGVAALGNDMFQEKDIGGQKAARSSRSAAVADFDNDGRLDVITNNFNDKPYYYRNQFPKRNYLKLALTGTKSNRDAIGAVVHLFAGSTRMVRQVEGAGGYLSCSSKIIHFGLGDTKSVDRIEIRWPDGSTQTVVRPEINKLLKVTEHTGQAATNPGRKHGLHL